MNDPPRILVVDDNEMNRDIIVTRLERHGYETFQAADGEEALAAAKQHCPDLVLLDVMMPHLDGIETCRRLKGDATFPFLVPTAKSKRLTATANRLILAADERPLQIDLVRLDRTVLAAGCVASRDPCPSTSTQRAAAQIPEAIGVR